jgi:hypothetical protein
MELNIVGVRALLAAQRRVLHEMRAPSGQLPPWFKAALPAPFYEGEKGRRAVLEPFRP